MSETELPLVPGQEGPPEETQIVQPISGEAKAEPVLEDTLKFEDEPNTLIPPPVQGAEESRADTSTGQINRVTQAAQEHARGEFSTTGLNKIIRDAARRLRFIRDEDPTQS